MIAFLHLSGGNCPRSRLVADFELAPILPTDISNGIVSPVQSQRHRLRGCDSLTAPWARRGDRRHEGYWHRSTTEPCGDAAPAYQAWFRRVYAPDRQSDPAAAEQGLWPFWQRTSSLTAPSPIMGRPSRAAPVAREPAGVDFRRGHADPGSVGRFNSTKTRVIPVFDELLDRGDAGWLTRLLALPSRDGAPAERVASPPIITARWGENEISLAPPLGLLRYLVTTPSKLSKPRDFEKQAESTRTKRQALLDGNAEVAAEALALLDGAVTPTRGWYVLEGPSRPDVFLETPDAIIVIEGKRIEPHHTTSTSWLKTRHQMLRHLDCAWEMSNPRRVLGFFVVEGERDSSVPLAWRSACDDTIAPETLANSLPHRSDAERLAIAGAFLGATSWQAVCGAFAITLVDDEVKS